jgi:hypothetical protein
MTRQDFKDIAALLGRDYAALQDFNDRRGYNLAIQTIIRFLAARDHKFDAIKFASIVYRTQSHEKHKKQ